MGSFLLRVIINAVAIAITAQLLPGITVVNDNIGTLLIIGLVFGIVNALLKPLLLVLTCPAVLLTLGLFVLVINGVMLLITASLLPNQLQVDGIGSAILGGIIMSIVTMILEALLTNDEKQKRRKPDEDVVIIDRR